MSRIATSEIERLKLAVSLERLVEACGVALKPHGKDRVGRCPFHDDKTPSLVVSPKANLWHCLGACQAGGSVIDWVMRFEGVSFRHAVELLRHDYAPGAALPSAKQSTVPKLAAPVAFDADDRALLAQVVDYYHATLQRSPEALAYLAARGIDNADAIARSAWAMPIARWGCACRKRTAWPARKSARACRSWASCASRATSTSTVRWSCR